MIFPRKRKGMVLKPKKSTFDNFGNLSGRQSLSFNLELVGRNSTLSAPKVVEEVEAQQHMTFPDAVQDIWPKNNKPRLRLPLKFFKNFKFPFFNRREDHEDSCRTSEEASRAGTPNTPINHDLHDSLSSVPGSIGFAHESYAVTEIALTDMARSGSAEPLGWNHSCTRTAFMSGSSWNSHSLMPPAKGSDAGSQGNCPADDEFFLNTPKAVLQRDWFSSPEHEVDNSWKSGSDSSAPANRRPSSAYGWTGSSQEPHNPDRRDSACAFDVPRPPRKGLDRGFRKDLRIDADLPVSFPALNCLSSPDSLPDTPGDSENAQASTNIPNLALGNLASGADNAQKPDVQFSRATRQGFGSDIPVLEEFAGLSSHGSHNSRTASLQEITNADQASSCGTLKESDIDSLFSEEQYEYSDYSPEGENEGSSSYSSYDGYHPPSEYYGTEEYSSGSWTSEDHSSQFLAHCGCQEHQPMLVELPRPGGFEGGNSLCSMPCMSIHPDDPDYDNRYPTTMVSSATSRSHEERILAGFNYSLKDKPLKTVLDVLEERACLKRKECSYRIACQRSFIRKMKSKLHKGKVAFNRLKQGFAPQLTDKVIKLRQKWGGGLRIRRQDKLTEIKRQDEEELWDLHFNEDKIRDDSDAESWVTDDEHFIEA